MQDPITVTMERDSAEELVEILNLEVEEADEHHSTEETMDNAATTISEALANQ